MRIIIGLGNPGLEYKNTRHNVGFKVIDMIASDLRLIPVNQTEIEFRSSDLCEAEVAEAHFYGEKVLLVKPQTFMNNSGTCVMRLADFYKVEPHNIWVVTDDKDLPLGTIRVRLEGSSGGHNGLNSIISHISANFPRIRLGIGQTTQIDMKEFDEMSRIDTKKYVLENFLPREEAMMIKTYEAAADIIINALETKEGIEAHTVEVE